jgi:di/tricarboxylate transporter
MQDAREFSIQMVIQPGSPLIGSSVAEGGLRSLEGVFLAELDRGGRRHVPVSPEHVLEEGDRLIFVGNVDRALDLQRIPGLVSAEEPHLPDPDAGPRHRFFEAVVAPGGGLDGKTLRDVGFRRKFNAAVMAIHRGGERVPSKLGTLTLRPGDVLLILAPGSFRRDWKNDPDFLLIAPLDGEAPPRREKARIVGLITLALFLVVGTGRLDILQAALLAAIALVGFKVLEPVEARNSVDLNVIMVIALSFGLGSALSTSGLADEIAGGFIGGLGPLGSMGLLLGVLLATSMLTELITNNAAAVLMFPIALSTAAQAGLNPRAFAIAVAIGASSSFLSPIGYQTNTMVYGMGGYHFGDFARVGLPLTVVMLIVAMIFIPIGWPL